MRHLLKTIALFSILIASGVHASVVDFSTGGSPITTTFADGTFSHNLSGQYGDGFANYGGPTSAYPYFGYNGEYIDFNAPVQFNSAQFKANDFGLLAPETLTISVLDSLDHLVASQTISSLTSTYQTVVFNTNNAKKIVFNFTGGADYYFNGLSDTWYIVNNVTYSANVNDVPEPGSLALLALGIVGFALSRKKYGY